LSARHTDVSSVPGLEIAVNTAHVAVFAAGNLRAPMTEMAQAFERTSGTKVVLTFGASGLLRDRIRSGERADVFASANMEHPQTLAALGWTERVDRFAHNAMCVLARPEIGMTPDTVLRTLLDPSVRVGTSTPKADPSDALLISAAAMTAGAQQRAADGHSLSALRRRAVRHAAALARSRPRNPRERPRSRPRYATCPDGATCRRSRVVASACRPTYHSGGSIRRLPSIVCSESSGSHGFSIRNCFRSRSRRA
jgi:hypothetical protein